MYTTHNGLDWTDCGGTRARTGTQKGGRSEVVMTGLLKKSEVGVPGVDSCLKFGQPIVDGTPEKPGV